MKNKKIYLLAIFPVLVFLAAIFNVIKISNDYMTTDNEYERLRAIATQTETFMDDDSGEEIYTYKQIDWNKLESINSDIVGWIYIPDTPVDYPIVQGETNDTYLRTSFEKKRASGGCIFMECQNNPEFLDQNTILYGHNMRNGSMFHCLNSYVNNEFFAEHPFVQIYTPKWSRTYKVISAHTDVSTGPSYRITFIDTPYKDWLSDMAARSVVKGQEASEYKNTVTLSVCHGKSGTASRMVLNIQLADDGNAYENIE